MTNERETPRVRWYEFGKNDPGEDQYLVTVDDQGIVAEHTWLQGVLLNDHGVEQDPMPRYWVEIVTADIDSTATPLFEFEWADPEAASSLPDGMLVVGVYPEAPRLRLVRYESTGWHGRGGAIGAPELWAPVRTTNDT